MYSQQTIELARIALYSYDFSDLNHSGLPTGYTELARWTNADTGFQVYAFESDTGQLVISFTGARFEDGAPLDIDWQTNILGGSGNDRIVAGGGADEVEGNHGCIAMTVADGATDTGATLGLEVVRSESGEPLKLAA